MRKSLLTFCILISLSYSCYSQSTYGIKVGSTLSWAHHSNTYGGLPTHARAGFQLGFTYEQALSTRFSFSSALQLTQKGYKVNYGNPAAGISLYRNYSFHYLEIPIDLNYQLPVCKAMTVLFGTGPVFSYAVAGRVKWEDVFAGRPTESGSDRYHFGNDKERKPFDFGWNALVGVQKGRIRVSSSYNYGFTNMLNYDEGYQSARNRSLALSVTYMLKR